MKSLILIAALIAGVISMTTAVTLRCAGPHPLGVQAASPAGAPVAQAVWAASRPDAEAGPATKSTGERESSAAPVPALLVSSDDVAPGALPVREPGATAVGWLRLDADLARSLRGAREPRAFSVDLGTGAPSILHLSPREGATPESVPFDGTVAGVPGGTVRGAVRGDAVYALVDLGKDGMVEIRSAGSGLHRVVAIDPTQLPEEAKPRVASAPPVAASPDGGPSAPPAAAPGAAGPVIDLMVLYSPASRAAAGGDAAIRARIDAAIADANSAYANTGLAKRLRLIHADPIPYAEASSDAFGTALDEMTFSFGGLAGVADLRDQHHADLVALLIDDRNYCGLGWIGNPLVSWGHRYGYSVSYWACLGPTYTLPHELGHNEGLAHDVDNARVLGLFDDSHGYQDDGHFHTVMAYDYRFGCDLPCPEIPWFSSPDAFYQGRPTGVRNEADAARTLDAVGAAVAAYRDAPSGCNDGRDDDGDGLVDFGADPGCASPNDTSERDAALVCDDGVDNDGDGLIDGDDPACIDPLFPVEVTTCDDGLDNDGDGLFDHPDDPGCTSPADASERVPACGLLGIELALLLGATRWRRRARGGTTAPRTSPGRTSPA